MGIQQRRTDIVLWSVIALYAGFIYSTLSLVSTLRKALVERYGDGVFDTVYWIFGAIAVGLLVRFLKAYRGKGLAIRLIWLAVIGLVYVYYLRDLRYAIERLHFLEYGLLGALLLVALRRRIENWTSFVIALGAAFWIGLGDEAIQWSLPDRVGEIGDSVLNLFSALLGMAVVPLASDSPSDAATPLRPSHLRGLCVSLLITTCLTSLFIARVHGFGYVVESKDPGRIFSAFKRSRLDAINRGKETLNRHDSKVYRNEALRHLHQREFYLDNDFLGSNGRTYKRRDRSFFENRVLERFYGAFLKEHGAESCGDVLVEIDRDVAERTDNPVLWPDTLRHKIEELAGVSNHMYESRVKGTIVTSYKAKDLAFYTVLICGLLVFFWTRIPAITTDTRVEETNNT